MSIEGQVRLSTELRDIAKGLEKSLSEISGEKVLFALHIFGEGTDGRSQYISNANREDVAKGLKELLARWEQTGGDDGPYHVFHKAH